MFTHPIPPPWRSREKRRACNSGLQVLLLLLQLPAWYVPGIQQRNTRQYTNLLFIIPAFCPTRNLVHALQQYKQSVRTSTYCSASTNSVRINSTYITSIYRNDQPPSRSASIRSQGSSSRTSTTCRGISWYRHHAARLSRVSFRALQFGHPAHTYNPAARAGSRDRCCNRHSRYKPAV